MASLGRRFSNKIENVVTERNMSTEGDILQHVHGLVVLLSC